MSAFVNDRDILLQATVPRNINPRAGKFLALNAVPVVFHVSATGAASPNLVTLTATLLNIPGLVTWSATGATLEGSIDNIRTVAFEDVTAAVVTVTATITYQGETYTASQVIQKVTDGAVGGVGDTGAPGGRSFAVRAYKWVFGAGAPTAIGTAIFNWNTLEYDPPPSGWSAVKPNPPGPGYSLYEASVMLADRAGDAPTSGIDWAGAARAPIGYIGMNGEPGVPGGPGDLGPQGNSAVIAYTLVTGDTLDASPDTIVVAGADRPAIGAWGSTRAWTATTPVPVAGQCVFQSMGIKGLTSTTWGLPFRSDLRVGSLSALSINTGGLVVDQYLRVYASGSIVVQIGQQ